MTQAPLPPGPIHVGLLSAGALLLGCLQEPKARDDQVSVVEDHEVTIDVVANDDDVERIVQGPSWSTRLQVVDRRHIRFTPEPDFEGEFRFSYQGVNEHGVSNAEVLIMVEPDLRTTRREFDVRRHPEVLAVGDFDADGLKDVAVLHADQAMSVAFQRRDAPGEPSFALTEFAALDQQFSTGPWPKQLVARDLDQDGIDDLVFGSDAAHALVFMLADGRGGFQRSLMEFPISAPDNVAVGDFDGDARLDLVMSQNGSGPASRSRLLRGLRFEGTEPRFESDMALGQHLGVLLSVDRDGDGTDELVAVDDDDGLIMLAHNTGESWRLQRLDDERWHGVSAADFDGDGRPDLLLVKSDRAEIVPSGRAAPIRLPGKWSGHALFDLDADGIPEVIQNEGLVQRVWRSQQTEPLAFRLEGDVAETHGWGLTLEDLDADGKPDWIMLGRHAVNVQTGEFQNYVAVHWGR